jgi:hypothetical protein
MVASGDYRPVPGANGVLVMARSGGHRGVLASSGISNDHDQTRSRLLLAAGAYLEDQAGAQHLG